MFSCSANELQNKTRLITLEERLLARMRVKSRIESGERNVRWPGRNLKIFSFKTFLVRFQMTQVGELWPGAPSVPKDSSGAAPEFCSPA